MKRRPDNWNTIYSRVLAAEKDFAMLEPGDRVLVALSGGADSLVLLDLLAHQGRTLGATLGLRIIAGHVPGRYRGRPIAPQARLRAICGGLGIELRISEHELADETFNDCFICARARRKLLFDLAESCGCNKIALGHNADDMVETALLNIMYAGHFAALNPRQPLLGGRITVIRPLAFAWKEHVSRYCRQRFGAVKRFSCPGSAGSKRMTIRRLLARLERDGSPVKANVLAAISNPKPEYLPRKSET
jgi:tRNA 2-thiocytidine biosynthesis protein TtcA